ncbi:DNA polymerase III, beta subunit [Cohaesibacter sp. ES.047]|uniref:DNA polymerase III subunit beta n=1 Tax=Cohaesibacter sp. ES.047 TaxID=1798205 RepID=UPI000BB9B598|nr:DNA polymerase III subunit beta [Cohaesibacter sp. ES.047]SNY93380.1 DNA polymerase III, beta subunit [Cohaesibacter sp. ES.047]
MHIIVDANILKPTLQKLCTIANRSSSVPILNCVSIRTLSQDRVQLTATDQDAELIVTIPAEVIESGYWAIEAHRLANAIASAADGSQIKLKLVKDNHRIEVRHGRSGFKLPCLLGDDMPHLNFTGAEWRIDLAGVELTSLLDVCSFAEPAKGHRLYLQGVQLRTLDGKLCSYASDGHRAARSPSDIEVPDGFCDVIVPTGNCHRIMSLFKDSTDLSLMAHKRMIFVGGGDYQLISKLIDAEPIDIERIIPKQREHVVRVDRKRLIATIDSLIGLTDKETRTLRFVVMEDGLYICLSEKTDAEGESVLEAKCQAAAMTVGINGSYVKDVCAAFDTAELDIHFDNQSANLFVANGNQKTTCVMPIRVQDVDINKIGLGAD